MALSKSFIFKKEKEHIEALNKSKDVFIKTLPKLHNKLRDTFDSNNKLMVCGNGGSAADAMHFSGEFVSKFKSSSRHPLPCLCLNTNISTMTSIGNDFAYKDLFKRQILAYGVKNDCILLLSTSGESLNVIEAAKIAKNNKIFVISFTGKKKTILDKYSDLVFKIPSLKTDIIQEIQMFYLHLICDSFENYKKK